MKILLVALIVACLAAAGCRRPNDQQQAALDWNAPTQYSYVIDSSCGEQSFIGTFRVSVADGETTEAVALDDSADAFLQDEGNVVPTLSDLLDETRRAIQDGADVVDVEVDPDRGHPVRIDIDYEANATDDESCYRISDYTE